MKYDDPLAYVDLGGGKPCSTDIRQGLPHIGDQECHIRRARIGDRQSRRTQDGMPHSGYLENGHDAKYGPCAARGNAAGGILILRPIGIL